MCENARVPFLLLMVLGGPKKPWYIQNAQLDDKQQHGTCLLGDGDVGAALARVVLRGGHVHDFGLAAHQLLDQLGKILLGDWVEEVGGKVSETWLDDTNRYET